MYIEPSKVFNENKNGAKRGHARAAPFLVSAISYDFNLFNFHYVIPYNRNEGNSFVLLKEKPSLRKRKQNKIESICVSIEICG